MSIYWNNYKNKGSLKGALEEGRKKESRDDGDSTQVLQRGNGENHLSINYEFCVAITYIRQNQKTIFI